MPEKRIDASCTRVFYERLVATETLVYPLEFYLALSVLLVTKVRISIT